MFRPCNDIWELSIEGKETSGLRARWTLVQVDCFIPCLNSHMCVLYKKDFLFFIGGDGAQKEEIDYEGTQNPLPEEVKQDFVTNSVYRLNLKIALISQDVTSTEFRPRMAHSGVLYDDKIFIFGGLERNTNFNSQLLKMSINRFTSQERPEKLSEAKSIKSDSKFPASCRFCDCRKVSSIPPQGSAHEVRRSWTDHSDLENKIKRRLT